MAKISKDDVLSYLETANMLEISELIKDPKFFDNSSRANNMDELKNILEVKNE